MTGLSHGQPDRSRRAHSKGAWLLSFFGFRRSKDRAPRFRVPGLGAFYWDGTSPKAHEVLNVSATGALLKGKPAWPVGTILHVSVQMRRSPSTGMSELVFPAIARIARATAQETAIEFIFCDREEPRLWQDFLESLPRQEQPDQEGDPPKGPGQALLEFALVLPLLFLLIANLVNFGAFIYAWITVANAARAGAQYAVLAGASLGGPVPPDVNQIAALVAQDVSSLINRQSLKVKVCTNYAAEDEGATVVCAGEGGPASVPTDPEPAYYVLTTVDVSYTYQPLISLWSFPGLGVHLTLPPTTIHRRAVMRMLQ